MGSDDLLFKKPEPEEFDRRCLKAGLKLESSEHIAWRVEKVHYDNFNSVSKEVRQSVLERWRRGGISIGDVAVEFGLDCEVVNDIIYLNIESVSRLRVDTL